MAAIPCNNIIACFSVWLHDGQDQEDVLQVRGGVDLRLPEQGHQRARA